MEKSLNVCVIGTGYVGSVTGTVLAHLGHQVTCVDANASKIKAFAQGPPFPLLEPGLPEMILRHRGNGLQFSSDVNGVIASADVIFVCVNTPTKDNGIAAGGFDMQYVDAVARQIAAHARADVVIVEKSTVPLRTAERIRDIVSANAPHWQGVHVVSNPEFLAEGTAVRDALSPDRVLVGTAPDDKHSRRVMNALYAGFPSELVLHTNVWSSELAKLANNAFLSTKITQINALASLCDASGADVKEVARAVGMDKRIGDKFLSAGIGWGGSCFGKDLRALIYLLKHYHLEQEAAFYQAAHDLNYALRERFVRRMHDSLHSLSGKTIAVLGFAFKPDTDDIRDAPAIDIIRMLAAEGAHVRVVDPAAGHKVSEVYAGVGEEADYVGAGKDAGYARRISVCESAEEAAEGADAVALVTEWRQFRELDLTALASRMRRPGWLFDGRNAIDSQKAAAAGLRYRGVGTKEG